MGNCALDRSPALGQAWGGASISGWVRKLRSLGDIVHGVAGLPGGCARAERCDALERRTSDPRAEGGRVTFTVHGRGTLSYSRRV
jgi:hypothetical protein